MKDMNDSIIYRPYKSDTWALAFSLPMGVFAFAVAGCCLFSSLGCAIVFLVGGMMCIWSTKVIYDSSKRAVIFEQNGLRIIGGSYSEYRYISWEEVTHGYYVRSYRGVLFLLISPNALNFKEAKRFANKGACSSRIFIDPVVVIPLDFNKEEEIKKFVEIHLTQVDTCDAY